jgi:hypothetical protein
MVHGKRVIDRNSNPAIVYQMSMDQAKDNDPMQPVTQRPFDFMVSVWGAKYRQYLVDRCLPSLLAPGNFPVLRAADGHRLLIATTPADWDAMKDIPILQAIRPHVTPQWVPIDPLDEKQSLAGSAQAILYHTSCQRKLFELAYAHGGYGSIVFPDTIVSQGMVASLQRSAAAGHVLVLCAAMRQTEETVMAELRERGTMPAGVAFSTSGTALNIPQRTMVDLAIRHLHPEVTIYDWEDDAAPPLPAHRFWRMPDNRGIVLRTYYGLPVLMDYSAVANHDVACLDEQIVEDVYALRNFYRAGAVHVVQDSDDFVIISLTPAAVGHFRSPADHIGYPRWWKEFIRLCAMRAAMGFYVRQRHDMLKCELFARPIRWHIGDLDEVWFREERRINRSLERFIGDYFHSASRSAPNPFPPRFSQNPWRFAADVYGFYIANAQLQRWASQFRVASSAAFGGDGGWPRIAAAVRRRASNFLSAVRFPTKSQ